MFAIGVVTDHNLIVDTVNMRSTFLVFARVVLHDKALLPFGNVSPVGFESDWEESVTTEHKLRRSGLHGGMDGRVDCFRNRGEVSGYCVLVIGP